MLEKKYLQKIRQELLSYAVKRREVIKITGDAQHLAKRAIFALQRNDKVEAEQALAKTGTLLRQINKQYSKDLKIFDEGSYKAALEEYTEAMLFKQFLDDRPLGALKGLNVDANIFIGGLCDVPGELVRYAIMSATERNFVMVKKCFAAAELIISELVDMDLTGYNRQKFDQAKQALHKLQQIVYEVSLKETNNC